MPPDDLYGLPLDEFIPQRTARVRALRADKKRDEANAVAALRKPSVAAWAVNQLVRTQGSAVQELYDAGDALRDAQSELLAGGGDAQALRAANARERAAVDTLVEAARGLLDADGHALSAAVVERVAGTLHAAALDEDARAQVRDGRLERELRHVGLGLGESVFATAPPAAEKKPAARGATEARETKGRRGERERRAREEAAAAKRAERGRAEARKAARSAESAARKRVERSGHALRAAEERRERAAQALTDADAALEAARAEAQEAAAAHRAAQEELERL